MALDYKRAAAIAELLVGKDPAIVNTLPAALAQAATDKISGAILSETAPGLDPVNDADNVAAAVSFFGLSNALTAAALVAAFSLLSTLPRAA